MSLLLVMLFFGSIGVGLMTSQWVMVVLMMELSLFCFIFLCNDYNMLSALNSMIKYFIVQSLGSIMLLLAGLVTVVLLVENYWLHLFTLSGMVLKLGVFPLHFWVIPTVGSLPYEMVFLFGSPLKMLPLMVINKYFSFFMFNSPFYSALLYLFLMGSMFIGAFLGLVSTSIRTMLGASSITHTGWMLLALKSQTMVEYFMFYSAGLLLVLLGLNSESPMLTAINMLSLGGLPPFSLFTGKMYVLYSSVTCNLPLMVLFLALISAIISLFYYLKFTINFYLKTTRFSVKFPMWLLVMTSANACAFSLFFL
uniref:NADH dehydrogenase subunit 2 n=1 Tax=Micrarionta opuntia TaxID=2914219 RepID=UPI001EF9EFF7|nr:NADH dehydrogenase subunit 2 [Micrarionta opuntia]UKG20833.1 NADH dehydrogenase subunit 2 [Micrarionta opuntia]